MNAAHQPCSALLALTASRLTGLTAAGALGLLVSGCAAPGRAGVEVDATATEGAGSGASSWGATEASSSGTSLGSSGSSSGGSSTGADPGHELDDAPLPGIKFDVAGWPEPPQAEGCQKVDFLFVIDNSGSMGAHQANLVANFPAFIQGIQTQLGDVDDYHVGVVTTDAPAGNPIDCRKLGALVTGTAGAASSGQMCGPYALGTSYMSSADDLDEEFSCAAQVGTDGWSYERPMDAVRVVVEEQLAGPGGCNEEFLRKDALLVLVIITDEADGPGDQEAGMGTSSGTPADWFDTVVAAKAVESNVVVLSMIKSPGTLCPATGWGYENLQTFTEAFSFGFYGGICETDWSQYFQLATYLVSDACDAFLPPG
jgi:hypothetical protein